MSDPFTGGDHEKWDAPDEEAESKKLDLVPDIAGRDIRTQTSDPGCEED